MSCGECAFKSYEDNPSKCDHRLNIAYGDKIVKINKGRPISCPIRYRMWDRIRLTFWYYFNITEGD